MNIDGGKLQDPDFVGALETGHAKLGFSQLGEDIVLCHLLHGKRDGFYVDVGCHDPFRFSNTAILSRFYGWSGLNIDLDETLIARFTAARPRDVSVCAAIGATAGTAELTVFNDAAANSISPEMTQRHKMFFVPTETRTVDVLPLRLILDRYIDPGRHIDLMSIDVEGMDFDVLTSNDWDRYRPDIIAIEAHDFDISEPAASKTYRYLRDLGYKLNSHLLVTSIYTRG